MVVLSFTANLLARIKCSFYLPQVCVRERMVAFVSIWGRSFPFWFGHNRFFLFLRISSRTTSFFSAKHFVRFCHPDLLPNRCSWYIYIYNISKNTLACSQKLKTTSVLISRHAALPPEPQSPRCLSVCVFFCKRWLCSPVKSIHYDSLACRIIFNGYFFSCGFSQSSKSLWKNFSPFLLQFIEALI